MLNVVSCGELIELLTCYPESAEQILLLCSAEHFSWYVVLLKHLQEMKEFCEIILATSVGDLFYLVSKQ